MLRLFRSPMSGPAAPARVVAGPTVTRPLKVHPFGRPPDRDVGLCVYNWLRGTWRSLVFPNK